MTRSPPPNKPFRRHFSEASLASPSANEFKSLKRLNKSPTGEVCYDIVLHPSCLPFRIFPPPGLEMGQPRHPRRAGGEETAAKTTALDRINFIWRFFLLQPSLYTQSPLGLAAVQYYVLVLGERKEKTSANEATINWVVRGFRARSS